MGEFVDRSVELDVLERAIYPGNRVRIHAILGYRLFGKNSPWKRGIRSRTNKSRNQGGNSSRGKVE